MLTTEKIVDKDHRGCDRVYYRGKVVLNTGEVVGEAVFGTPENARYFAVRDAWARGHAVAALGHARSSGDRDLQEWAEEMDKVLDLENVEPEVLAKAQPNWLWNFEEWVAVKRKKGLVD